LLIRDIWGWPKKCVCRERVLLEGNLYPHFGKRSLDLPLTLPAVILLFSLYGILALLIRRRMGSPVLFRQMRPGFHGRPFHLLKLRTMNDESFVKGAFTA